MPQRTRRPLTITGGLAALTGLLAVLTALVPDWIEAVFGVDPDGGNGAVETDVVITLAVLCAASLVTGGLLWRTLRPSAR